MVNGITPRQYNLSGRQIEIYLVPHTHLDPGWIETFEDYYSKKVRVILLNVIKALKADPNKIRITIRLDGDIIEHFKKRVHDEGGGNYQTLLNDTLRQYIQSETEPLEDTLRKVIREELKLAK